MPEVMQVIPKTYDLILWLIPRWKEAPRDQRSDRQSAKNAPVYEEVYVWRANIL